MPKKRFLDLAVKAKQGDAYTIHASTNAIDRDGDIVLPSSFKNLQEYLSLNPVGLWGHDAFVARPVFKATAGRITDEGLELDITFADTELGREVKYLYDNGFLNSFSIGFIIRDYEMSKDGVRIITDAELVEVSAVSVPANKFAVMQRSASAKGFDLTTIAKLYDEREVSTESKAAPDGESGPETGSGKPKSKAKRKLNIKEIHMDQIQLLRLLISKTDDEAEKKNLEKQLEEAIAEKARADVRAELEAERKAEGEREEKAETAQAASETKMAKGVTVAPRIEVKGPGEYRGYNLKSMIGQLQKGAGLSKAVKVYSKENPEDAELVAKWFVDKLHTAKAIPADMVQKATMVEGTAALGGYLTPTEERMAVLAYIRETSFAMRDCQHVPMTSDSMTMSRENYKVSVAYTSEGSDATETSATFAQITLTAKRMDAYTKVTNELLDDDGVPGGVAGILAGQFLEAVGQKLDSTVFKGTGDPVSGVFLSAGYSEVFSSGSTHFSELLESNLRGLIAKIPSSRLGNAKWYSNRSPVWTYIYGLKDGDSRALFIPSYTDRVPHQLMGWPLEIPEETPSTSAAATGFIVFGDLSGFLIGDRLTNVSLFRDPYTLSRSYTTQFLMFTRWGFAHALPNYYGRIVTAAS